VSVGAENFREDGLALGRDAVAALPEHGQHRPDPVHAVRLLHRRCGDTDHRSAGPLPRPAADRLMIPAGR
jgi:hypothetical protein